jgi:hypothetical protein
MAHGACTINPIQLLSNLLNPRSFLLPFSRPSYQGVKKMGVKQVEVGVHDYKIIMVLFCVRLRMRMAQLLSYLQVAYGARTIGPVSLPPDVKSQAPSFSLLFDHHIPREKETGVKEIEIGMHVGGSRRWALGIDVRRVQGFSISSVTGASTE